MPEFFDTHAHLSEACFDADRAAVLDRAAAAGVSSVVEIADSPKDWEKAVALSRARPGQVRASLGLHPYYAAEFSPKLLHDLDARARLPEVVAVGEIGLDYAKSDIPAEVQRRAFADIFSACLSWGKPAVIHCRAAYPDLRAIVGPLCPAPPPDRRFWGVVHCFSGDAEDAVFFSRRGFALGVDGPVTYPKNEGLREALRQAGAASHVLETDSPYLPPQSSRGRRNEPSAVVEIAVKLSEILGLPLPDVARLTTENARALYGMGPGA